MSASLFENKPESCPFGHQLWPGKAQVSWTPCICEPTLPGTLQVKEVRIAGAADRFVICCKPRRCGP